MYEANPVGNIETFKRQAHLSEEVDGRVRVFDKHLRAEPQLLPDKTQILRIVHDITVGLLSFQCLQAPKTALST